MNANAGRRVHHCASFRIQALSEALGSPQTHDSVKDDYRVMFGFFNSQNGLIYPAETRRTRALDISSNKSHNNQV